MRRFARGLATVAFITTVDSLALAQGLPPLADARNPPQAAAATRLEDPLGRQTPAGTVAGFVAAASRGDYSRAARYLDTKAAPAQAEGLAAQLKVLLDRGLSLDPDRLSRKPEGEQDGRVGRNREVIGTIESQTGEEELTVVLARVQYGADTPVWLFSADTLRQVPAWHRAFQPSLLERLLPARRGTVFTWTSWLVSLALCGVLFGIAWLFARLACGLARLARRRRPDALPPLGWRSPAMPLQWLVFGIGLWALSGSLLTLRQRYVANRVGTLVIIGAVAWIVIRLSAVGVATWSRRIEGAGRIERVAVVRLGSRLFQAIVVIAAALAMLGRIGVELTPVLAGLGVGGIAVALASQKTLENLFGGMMVIGDSPVRIGHFCRVGAMTGSVEDIGLRSTRIRTLARTVIAVPNAEMAASSVEDFGARDKILFDHAISLRYETTADQLRAVLEGSVALLRGHPHVEPTTVRVRLLRFAPSGMEIQLFAYVRTQDPDAFLAVQEELLLATLGLVESSGTALALPSQITYLAQDLAPAGSRAAAAG